MPGRYSPTQYDMQWFASWAEIQINGIDEETARIKNRFWGEKLEHVISRANFVGVVDDDQLDSDVSQKVERIMTDELSLKEAQT